MMFGRLMSPLRRNMAMTQQELVELHAALGVMLSWPASIRQQIAAWLHAGGREAW
jgi:hypothetical protein